MQATALPPFLEGLGPFSQAAENKFGVQMPWQHGLDGSAAQRHSHIAGIQALHQAALTAGLRCLYFSDNSWLTENQIFNQLQPGMASPCAERPVSAWPQAGADVKIVWVIAISTAIVFINFLKWFGEINLFFFFSLLKSKASCLLRKGCLNNESLYFIQAKNFL